MNDTSSTFPTLVSLPLNDFKLMNIKSNTIKRMRDLKKKRGWMEAMVDGWTGDFKYVE